MTAPSIPDPTLPTVAVLGTGRMGAPIARNLLAAGFPTVVWNRTPERAAPVVDAGAVPARSAAEATAGADIVLTMLADGEATADALAGPRGVLVALRPRTTWIQMATVGIEWTARFERVAEEHGVEFVDAPVSGGDGPAQAGTLLVLASGGEGSHRRVQPIFDAIGRTTLWLGPAGNGTRLKLVLINWAATQLEGVAETIALTETLGLDARLFTDAIADAPLGSPYAVAKARAMIDGDFTPGFALRLGLENVGLALVAGKERDLELPLTNAIWHRWQQAMIDGHADDDVAAVITVATAQPAPVP